MLVVAVTALAFNHFIFICCNLLFLHRSYSFIFIIFIQTMNSVRYLLEKSPLYILLMKKKYIYRKAYLK